MAESTGKLMNPIGGYFSLELPLCEEYHRDAIRLNTGRNCLEYVIRSRKYRKVYIPYYTCEVILEPFHKTGVEYGFYHINRNLEIAEDVVLLHGEALLYTNYYGLMQRYVEKLADRYGQQLIIDNTQAFYAKPLTGIDTFYTCRKFFGVPEGAYLYTDQALEIGLKHDVSWDRMAFLTKRIDLGAEVGYTDFLEMEERLSGQPIKLMSKLTWRLMQSVDYEGVANKRRRNYQLLHDSLGGNNLLDLYLDSEDVPMVYPLYIGHGAALRQQLIENKVFCARYWPNVIKWCQSDEWEYQLTTNLVCLPIDQRYDREEMKRMIEIINDK